MLLPPPGVDSLHSPEPVQETLGIGEESHPRAKNFLISPTFNKVISSLVKSVIPSPANSNIHVIILQKFHLWLSHSCYIIFLTSALVYTHVIFNTTKALNGQNSPKQNLHFCHLLMLSGK